MAANRWDAVQVSCTLQRLSRVRQCLRGTRKSRFFSEVEQEVRDRCCSRWKRFNSSMPPSLQSSNLSPLRAGSQVDSCVRYFLFPERTNTLPTCRWARLRQNRRLYLEKSRSTTLKPSHRGRDLSNRCLKWEQVHRRLNLSLQDRKLNTCNHSSAGSCINDVMMAFDCCWQQAQKCLIVWLLIITDTWSLDLLSQFNRKLQCRHHDVCSDSCYRWTIGGTLALSFLLLFLQCHTAESVCEQWRSHSNLFLLSSGKITRCW